MIERALIEYIANTLWQIPLLATGAWLLLWIVKPRPEFQHGVWLAVLGLAVLLPMHGMVKSEPTVMSLQLGKALPSIVPVQYAAISPKYAPRTHRIRLGETSTRWLVRLYLATVVFSLFRVVHSWFVGRHMVVASREISLGEEDKRAFESYGQRLSISLPQVRESGEVRSPLILGVANPVLLLPIDFARFPANEVKAALCHELAHVKRRDYLSNLLCHLVALPVAWHPLMAVVQQRIRMTREMVCDAMAAREMESPLGYASSLLALARGLLGGLEMAEQAQFPGLFGNRLEERVARLMDRTTMSVRTKVTRVLSGAVVTIATVSTAAILHVTPTMAEPQPAAPPHIAQTAPVTTEVPPAEAAAEPVTPVVPDEQPHCTTRKRTPRTAEVARDAKGVEQEAEDMQQQALRMKAMLDGPEFKFQIEEARRQPLQAQIAMNSAEIKRQIDEAAQRASQSSAMFDSPQFKSQIEEARRQALQAQTVMNSAEIKHQIEEAVHRATRSQAMLIGPEIQRQLQDAQQRMLDGKQQMEDAARRLAEADRELNDSSDEGREK
jgi:beta-lactamase regulating signal transducer with metallopeptidase domain